MRSNQITPRLALTLCAMACALFLIVTGPANAAYPGPYPEAKPSDEPAASTHVVNDARGEFAATPQAAQPTDLRGEFAAGRQAAPNDFRGEFAASGRVPQPVSVDTAPAPADDDGVPWLLISLLAGGTVLLIGIGMIAARHARVHRPRLGVS
jgi:hypothetical protein